MAERVGFEPTIPVLARIPLFESGAFSRSATSPHLALGRDIDHNRYGPDLSREQAAWNAENASGNHFQPGFGAAATPLYRG